MKRKWLALVLALVLLCALGGFGFGAYVNDYYHAQSAAVAALESGGTVEVIFPEKNVAAFVPEEPQAGLIFYPGGKVEYIAYAPLMRALADRGILCVLPQMPCNLAVLDINAAHGLTDHFPAVDLWYLGGHSLGGSMAASYAAKHSDAFAGLVLLASYSTADLTDSGLRVLSVYGSRDGVLKLDSYQKYRSNLPADFAETVLEGGNHCQFGDYGFQEGDGEAAISGSEQLRLTADLCAEYLLDAA